MAGNRDLIEYLKRRGLDLEDDRQMEASCSLLAEDLSGENLQGADLSGLSMREANLSGADLSRANLSDVELKDALLVDSNLEDANLTLANLHYANLAGANLKGANLKWTRFHRTTLDRTDFTGAFMFETVLAGLDLRHARGLSYVRHRGPSSIGIDTLLLSNGEIVDEFLRGASVPEDFLGVTRACVGTLGRFNSCFVSYSNKDAKFVEKLSADLRRRGVQCFDAMRSLRSGDSFPEEIEQSIMAHNRLLIILSENSIYSPWVQSEVAAGLEREQREGTCILLPIRLDDAVDAAPEGWAADLHSRRHIGDFRRWKSMDGYERALRLLLRDLEIGAEPGSVRSDRAPDLNNFTNG